MNTLFTTITRHENEDALDFHERVVAAITGRIPQEAWAESGVVVGDGYDSPYRFGRELRERVGDCNATIFRFHAADRRPLYVAFAQDAVVYDPAQRGEAQRPAEVDYFAAADALS